ncbi:uncharacterized protein LTHEOB_391 [Neofusicoccum parvum]|nr:uncharacterized protein LTHEOB_391 [Neofusicoccum parvum]
MAEPSPKRRRTSAEPDVSATGDFRPRNALRRTPPRRASWLSPTKASLARFNPEILSRRASAASAAAEPAAGPADPPTRGQRALSYVLGESQQQPDRPDAANAPAQGPPEGERRHSIGGRLLPSRDVLQAAAADQLAHESAQAEKRTTSAADTNDDLPSHPAESPAARPDLPPREGLFSSPSKRPRRNRSLGQRLSSPFKPRESPLRLEPPASAGVEESSPTPRERVQRLPLPVGAGAAEQTAAPVEPKKEVVDPRLKEKERLQKQLRELQEEVKQYEREIERSRNAPDDENVEDLSTLM